MTHPMPLCAQLPEPLPTSEAHALGAPLAGPMPGQPAFTLVAFPEGDSLYVGTLGHGQPCPGEGSRACAMLYAGELAREQTHHLQQAATAKGLQLWQGRGDGSRAATWLLAWLPDGAKSAEVQSALRGLHTALDGIVGDPASPQPRQRMLARVRRAGTCLAGGRYVMTAGALVDLDVLAPEASPAHDTPPEAPEHPRLRRAGRLLPPMPSPLEPGDMEGTPPPDLATCRAGSVEWLLATAASMGTWDGSDSTVNIRRPRGGGWYGAHIDDGSHPMLRRIPRGTFGYVGDSYVCYVTPIEGRKKAFVIHSSAGTGDDRCAPVLAEICSKLPGARIVRRALPTPQRPLFQQPDQLPTLTIHKDL